MRTISVGINGAGRIGRLVIRLLSEHPQIEISCINDLMSLEFLRYLLTYDTVHHKFNGRIEVKKNKLIINKKEIPFERHKKPSKIPWEKYNTDIVIESSGKFLTKKTLEKHLRGSVGKVILSCPAKDTRIKTIIFGINDNELSNNDIIMSNASCTANGAAPMLKIMDDKFEIETAFLITVHPFTNNQRIMDAPHPDPRRSRSLANNIIPTHSTAIKALLDVFPHLKGKFEGIAIRVPILAGALLELIIKTRKPVSVASINESFLQASNKNMNKILDFTVEELVSSDIIGNPASCVFDSKMTKVISKHYCYIAGWYDNEFGYANRVVNLIEKISSF